MTNPYCGRAPFPPDPMLAGISLFEGQRMLGGMNIMADERVVLWRRQGGRCFYCDEPMVHHHNLGADQKVHPRAFTLDHLLTRTHGGRDHRKVAACRTCNNRRGSMSAHDFIRLIAIEQGIFVPRVA